MTKIEELDTQGVGLDEVGRYLDSSGRVELLTKDEEVELARTIERGREAEARLARGRVRSEATIGRLRAEVAAGSRARDRFVLANLRLVISIAKKYQGQGLTLLDLVQEGNIGLMRAVDLFDWRKGFKFSTYATWWIRQAITRGIADRGRLIRIPVHLGDQVRKVRATERRLFQETGDEPAPAAIAEELHLPVEEVERLLDLDPGDPVSLQTPIGEDGELGELVAEDADDGPAEIALEGLSREAVARALSELSEQERHVLTLRFGLDGAGARSLRLAAKDLGVSAERVRQIEQRALSRLRASDALKHEAA